MTLSDFVTFSTAISGLAVTASLIYLALQTHQNAKHMKASLQQGRAERIIDFYSAFSDTDRVSAFHLRQIPRVRTIRDLAETGSDATYILN